MLNEQAGFKYITVEKLIDLLQTLPKKYWIAPNTVGNFLIMNDYGKFVGYIDILLDGDLVFDEEQDEKEG